MTVCVHNAWDVRLCHKVLYRGACHRRGFRDDGLSQPTLHPDGRNRKKARELLEKMAVMEPHVTSTFLTLANVCYIQEDYKAMEEAAGKAIAIEEGNAVAHFLLGKARKGQDDEIMTIAHLTKAITLKDDFIEARLMRAEALLKMKQYKGNNGRHADAVLAQNPEEETAILLRGKVKKPTDRKKKRKRTTSS